ncbi:MAG TPA: SUMF1/EgtB/PvdO family nonheme iron enzyme, partial [Gemmataceae bacterium]|nr:SUMF1/EgtB/PvdO family nonheme iron enzyme [Gemmataceae bacterium]
KDPEERYPSCSEWAAELEEALPEEARPRTRSRLSVPQLPVGQETTEQIPSQSAAPPRRRRLGVLSVLLLMLLAAGVPAGIFAYKQVKGGGGGAAVVTPTARATEPSAAAASFALGAPPPVALVIGRDTNCNLPIQHQDFREPIQLTCSGLPDGVTMDPVTVKPGDPETVSLHFTAEKKASPSKKSVVVRAEAGKAHTESTLLDLTVLFLPANGEVADPEVVPDINGRPYYKRIRLLVDGMPFEFVVIPQERGSDPETFYMMVDKVSVAQFRKFAARPTARVTSDWDRPNVGDDCPALGMTVGEAYRFAHDWLGGELPNVEQWAKAAGLHDHKAGQEGPYQGHWTGKGSLHIAVGKLDAPLPLPSTTDDVGPYGCRDMAGDGNEWTSTATRQTHPVAVTDLVKGDLVQLRGWSYHMPTPLSYETLRGDGRFITNPAWEYGSFVKPDYSFRVVLPIEPGQAG